MCIRVIQRAESPVDLTLRLSDLASLGLGPKACISDEFLGNSVAAGEKGFLEERMSNKLKKINEMEKS